ncbi:autoinducer binding domain-containing protein [Mesorhizobium sp. L-8-3]|uniref:autoinducer binding domain-containing protein n=1 Tax=Mesorhizobium sp. L-8-3 TaxID=2744522 RepID=UPI001928A1A8|nr:autoinducer binding domain-containing protein [Mesorhizobium sp. L-8-3]
MTELISRSQSAKKRWAVRRAHEWQKRYFEMGYDRIDPIIKASRARAGAFRWSEVYNDVSTTEDERRVFDEAATFGLRSGISVPLHGPGGSFAIMSFAQARDGEFQNRRITYLQLAALHFHLRVTKFANSSGIEETPDLSPRQKGMHPMGGEREIVVGNGADFRNI